MRRCFSAPTPSKPAGKSCSRSSTLGQTIRRGISRITPQAAAALLRPTNCWRAMAAPGGRSTEQSRGIDAEKRKISLVLSDVDGTLVTEEKILTEQTREAMLAKAPVPRENIHPIPTDGAPEDAARRYEQTLQEAYG